MKSLDLDELGRLPLPTRVKKGLTGNSFALVSWSNRHLLLEVAGARQPVLFSGRLGELSVPDLISFFNMFRRSGLLHFDLSAGQKDVYFQDGEIVFATSTYPEESLGEVLMASGKLTPEQLQECRKAQGAGRPLANILLERKLVAEQDLWVGGRQQAELIVYNLFAEQEGSFYHCAAEIKGIERLRMSMNTQNLLMEGLRRLDERTLFMRRIPSLEALVVPGPKANQDDDSLAADFWTVMDMVVSGPLPVRELVKQAGIGEFEALRVLYQLAEKKWVQFEEPEIVSVEGVLAQILDLFNENLEAVYTAVLPHHASFHQEIEAFLRGIPQPYSFVLRDVAVGDDGRVDGGRIHTNLEGLNEHDQRSLLADTLSELYYMECMTAQRVLPPAQAMTFIQQAQAVTRQIRELTGRKTR